jgi:hypothetical protein
MASVGLDLTGRNSGSTLRSLDDVEITDSMAFIEIPTVVPVNQKYEQLELWLSGSGEQHLTLSGT